MAFILLKSTHRRIVSELEKARDNLDELCARQREDLSKERLQHRQQSEKLENTIQELAPKAARVDEAEKENRRLEQANRCLRNNIFWTNEYLKAVEKLVSPEEKDSILFISGAAGTGKSLLMGILEKIWRASHPGSGVAKVAPTGIAAAHVGGMTIHSFFGFPINSFLPKSRYAVWAASHRHDGTRPMPELSDQEKASAIAQQCEYLSTISLLMVDEVSMVSPDLIDSMDQSLKILKENNRPFGGCKVVFFGDLGQLPPVYKEDDPRRPNFNTVYKENKPYFFAANILKGFDPKSWPIHLTTVFRQSEGAFMLALSALRSGKKPDLESGLNSILDCCAKGEVSTQDKLKRTTLYPKNPSVTKTNDDCLKALHSTIFTFPMAISDDLQQALLDPNHWFSKDDFRYMEKLMIAVGARVMILKNNPREHYFNGTIGEVVKITDSVISVREVGFGAPREPFEIGRDTIQVRDPRLSSTEEEAREGGKVIGEYSQFPLKLAWAITIHKSQGQTFDELYLDLTEAWELPLVYVAFSRVRRLSGVHLVNEIPAKCWKNYPERVRPWLGPPPRLASGIQTGKKGEHD